MKESKKGKVLVKENVDLDRFFELATTDKNLC